MFFPCWPGWNRYQRKDYKQNDRTQQQQPEVEEGGAALAQQQTT